MNTFDYIKNINSKDGYPDTLDGYESFIANKNFSNIQQTVLYANEINVDCDKQLNFDFYYYALPKGKRFGKWFKKQKVKSDISDVLNNIVAVYNCSMKKAQDIYDILESHNLLDQFTPKNIQGGKLK